MEQKNHLDFTASICTFLVGLYSLLESRSINAQYYARPQHSDFLTSPALMPMILGIALMLFSLILLARALRRAPVRDTLSALKASAGAFFRSDLVHRTLLGLVWMGVYVYGLLKYLPFAAASFIFLVVIMLLLRSAKPWKVPVISAITVVAVVLLFQGVFHVRLP